MLEQLESILYAQMHAHAIQGMVDKMATTI